MNNMRQNLVISFKKNDQGTYEYDDMIFCTDQRYKEFLMTGEIKDAYLLEDIDFPENEVDEKVARNIANCAITGKSKYKYDIYSNDPRKVDNKVYYKVSFDDYLKDYLQGLLRTKEPKDVKDARLIIISELYRIFSKVSFQMSKGNYASGLIYTLTIQKQNINSQNSNYQIFDRPTPAISEIPEIENIIKEYLNKYKKYSKNNHRNTAPKPREKPATSSTTENKHNNLSAIPNISPDDIIKMINKTQQDFVGQEEVVKQIYLNIYNNLLVVASGKEKLLLTQKSTILLEGATGTGKTAIINSVAESFSLPIKIVDSQSFSAVGYVGNSLSDILVSLLNDTNGNLSKAQQAIVCFDEFDKLFGENKDKELEMKKAIQKELLTFIGGHTYEVTYNGRAYKFNTSKLTIICMGAFTRLREQKNNALNRAIGFGADWEKNESYPKKNNTPLSSKELIDYGLERELVGRINVFISTKKYSINDLKTILLESEISPLKSFIDWCALLGINVKYNNEFIEITARKAFDLDTGARGLITIMNEIKSSLLYSLLLNKNKEVFLSAQNFAKAPASSPRRQ